MTHPSVHDTSPCAQAWRARKKPVTVRVVFAREAGTLATREGPVRYAAGAALLTAGAGDRWPVERRRFEASYEAVPGTAAGEDGEYRKLPLEVLARRLDESTTVTLGHAAGALHGEPGDWLVQYGPREFGIVGAAIFPATYELLAPVLSSPPAVGKA